LERGRVELAALFVHRRASLNQNTVDLMRKWLAVMPIIAALVIVVVALNLPPLRSNRSASGTDEQQLEQLLRQWDEAYARRDPEAIAPLLAPDFVFTSSNGQLITRPMYLSASLKSPDIAVETPINSEDVKIHIYGEVAVVTSMAAQRGQRFDRDPKVRFRYTDVWVKRNGRWQAVTSQSTRVMPH